MILKSVCFVFNNIQQRVNHEVRHKVSINKYSWFVYTLSLSVTDVELTRVNTSSNFLIPKI